MAMRVKAKRLQDISDARAKRREHQLPERYAELEYSDFENAEAIDGARWDDRNYLHYMER
jgi:hypothetical protein